jgi:hypothetical protein
VNHWQSESIQRGQRGELLHDINHRGKVVVLSSVQENSVIPSCVTCEPTLTNFQW